MELKKTLEREIETRITKSRKKVNGKTYEYNTKFIATRLYVPAHINEDKFVIERYEDKDFTTILYVIRPKNLKVKVIVEGMEDERG